MLFVNLNYFEFKLDFISWLFFAKDLFVFRIWIGNSHASTDLMMVGHVFKFQSNRMNFISSRKF